MISKKHRAMLNHDSLDELKELWIDKQEQYKLKIVENDLTDFTTSWRYVGGLDISFIVGDEVNACACYVVLDPSLQIVYKEVKMVKLTAPYVPGFLAFRESEFLSELVSKQRQEMPDITPDVLIVDGNGILHPRFCGLGCHIGVDTNIPTIGVAKNLHQIEELGPQFSRDFVKDKFSKLTKRGDFLPLSTSEGRTLGAVVKTVDGCKNGVFVSIGSGVSLESSIKFVTRVSRHRIPEPTRQADIVSREFLRLNHPTDRQKQKQKKKSSH